MVSTMSETHITTQGGHQRERVKVNWENLTEEILGGLS